METCVRTKNCFGRIIRIFIILVIVHYHSEYIMIYENEQKTKGKRGYDGQYYVE